ncbi:hypothetical protein GAB14E_0284 [Colwellia psychrerythraea]|uniref:Uncharacterized protein n=1 Tax=Colwellia psychrerythraea TaxID=28229 RepID=A0A099L2E6_COLPS|nr:hypothetical protein GAB14E_0284 [Colwellia psychrerythraea]
MYRYSYYYIKQVVCRYHGVHTFLKGEYLIQGKGLISGVIDLDEDSTWMVFLDNSRGTGSTLLDNAGAYYPELILLSNHSIQSMPCP